MTGGNSNKLSWNSVFWQAKYSLNLCNTHIHRSNWPVKAKRNWHRLSFWEDQAGDPHRTYLSTATSFLNAFSCCGVGSVTLSLFIATCPWKYPLYTVPNEPDPNPLVDSDLVSRNLPIFIASRGLSDRSWKCKYCCEMMVKTYKLQ